MNSIPCAPQHYANPETPPRFQNISFHYYRRLVKELGKGTRRETLRDAISYRAFAKSLQIFNDKSHKAIKVQAKKKKPFCSSI
jgi:hypothetical protein